jgi:hypothetical protein
MDPLKQQHWYTLSQNINFMKLTFSKINVNTIKFKTVCVCVCVCVCDIIMRIGLHMLHSNIFALTLILQCNYIAIIKTELLSYIVITN